MVLLFIILYFVLSCMSAFGVAFRLFTFEEGLPLVSSSVILVLFLCGIVGNLLFGVVVVLVVSLLLHIIAWIKVLKNKQVGYFLKNFFTPGFFVFLLSYIALIYFNYGHAVYKWDEFSHWADIVKVMTQINDFGASPLSNSLFKSYPPGMALFQYFYQAVGRLVIRGYVFTDWWLYHSYQIFFLTFIFPLVGWKRSKEVFISVALFGIIILSPLAFYTDFYSSLYIDAILGILSGCGLYALSIYRENKILWGGYTCCVCSMLALTKDAGLCFAIFILLASICDGVKKRESNLPIKAAILGCFVFAPKLLWSYELVKTNSPLSFSGKVNFGTLLEVITGRDSSYRSDAFKSFWYAVFHRKCVRVNIGSFEMVWTYLFVFVVFIFILFAICLLSKKDKNQFYSFKLPIITAIIETAVYEFGLVVMYIFKFSEYEATRLASFERYTNIGFLSLWMIIVLTTCNLVNQTTRKKRMILFSVLCLASAIITPWSFVRDFASRKEVDISIKSREQYVEICEKIKHHALPGDSIYLISEEDIGFDYWNIRYSVRPINVVYPRTFGGWSIGKAFYDGDIWTVEMSSEEWQRLLIDSYDYVVLCRINDYFVKEFGRLFCDQTKISENEVYYVLPDGRLSLCE